MAQGTLDVTNDTDIQKRTDPSAKDRILMINPVTREVQYLESEQVYAGAVNEPDSSEDVFDI